MSTPLVKFSPIVQLVFISASVASPHYNWMFSSSSRNCSDWVSRSSLLATILILTLLSSQCLRIAVRVKQGNRGRQTSPPGPAAWWVTLSLRPIGVASAWPIMGKTTSSTKPEVHNVLHYRPRRTEPRSQVICTSNFATCRRVVLRHASGHSDTLILVLRSLHP